MIHVPAPFDPEAPIIVIDIGNTSVKVGTWVKEELKTPLSITTDDTPAVMDAIDAHLGAMPDGRVAAVAIASVVREVLDRVREHVETMTDRIPLVVGEKLPLPIEIELKNPATVGMDRVCAAAAAYDKLQSSCTVIDFGSAVTVDLVNDGGKFVGGAIFPGVAMQLRALHDQTAVLPHVPPAILPAPFGRDTTEAIQNGVCRGVAGAARGLVEAYSSYLSYWPHVVATGGDLEWLLPHCDFIDTAVADLALRGVGVAYTKYLAALGA